MQHVYLQISCSKLERLISAPSEACTHDLDGHGHRRRQLELCPSVLPTVIVRVAAAPTSSWRSSSRVERQHSELSRRHGSLTRKVTLPAGAPWHAQAPIGLLRQPAGGRPRQPVQVPSPYRLARVTRPQGPARRSQTGVSDRRASLSDSDSAPAESGGRESAGHGHFIMQASVGAGEPEGHTTVRTRAIIMMYLIPVVTD
jgi:hypothetical protein